jgi:hypothetical protein
MRNPFRYFNSSPEVIRLVVMMYIRYQLSAVAATGRGYSVRARHRHLPRDDTVLVESLRSDVRQRDQETTPSSSVIFAMALALGRGVCQDQWRDALSLASGGSRRRSARGFRDEAPGSQGCTEVSQEDDETLWPARFDRD